LSKWPANVCHGEGPAAGRLVIGMQRKMRSATGLQRRIGRVLRQFHNDAIAIIAAGVVFFRVGIFAETRGVFLPSLQVAPAQLTGCEWVRVDQGSRSRSTASTAFSSRACSGGGGVGR